METLQPPSGGFFYLTFIINLSIIVSSLMHLLEDVMSSVACQISREDCMLVAESAIDRSVFRRLDRVFGDCASQALDNLKRIRVIAHNRLSERGIAPADVFYALVMDDIVKDWVDGDVLVGDLLTVTEDEIIDYVRGCEDIDKVYGY